MMEKNVLIVCRKLSDTGHISSISPKTGYRYVLASDDPRVHEIGRHHSWISEVCWLEQMESWYSVSDKVIDYIEAVNMWLRSLGNDRYGVPPDLLFWFFHVEGGMTTQRIQDSLLIINAYLSLLDSNSIQSVILIKCSEMQWEDEVLIETAKTRGIHSTIVGRFRSADLVKRFQNVSKMIARQPYYILTILRTKYSATRNSIRKNISENEIIFQICSSEEKHVENIVSIMKAVAEIGYNPVALCWKAHVGANNVRKSGLATDEMERYVTLKDILFSLYQTLQTFIKAVKLRKAFMHNTELYYRNVPLGKLLWPSVLFYFATEILHRSILDYASRKYFISHFPLAIKLWAGHLSIESHLAMKYMDKAKKPLLMYWFWNVFDDPYESKNEIIDLFLASGKSHERYLKRMGVSSDRIALTGMARYDALCDFQKIYSREDSLNHLKIPSTFSSYIVYDPNLIIRGLQTAREQVDVIETLLNFAMNNPKIGLIIKPHPSHSPGTLEDRVNKYFLKNVFWVAKGMQPYHALNAADLLITKCSTIGLEAMFFECPIISVILDGVEKFKVYSDAAEYIMTRKALSEFLNLLVKDDRFRKDWETRQIRKQKTFMKDYFFESEFPSATLGAKAIDQHIKK